MRPGVFLSPLFFLGSGVGCQGQQRAVGDAKGVTYFFCVTAEEVKLMVAWICLTMPMANLKFFWGGITVI